MRLRDGSKKRLNLRICNIEDSHLCAQIICYALLLPHYSKVIYMITLQASHVYYSIIIAITINAIV